MRQLPDSAASPAHHHHASVPCRNIIKCFGVCRIPEGCAHLPGLCDAVDARSSTWAMILDYCEVSGGSTPWIP